MCPGRSFALRTVYLVVACVLSLFDIKPALDEDGKPQVPEAEFDGLIIRYVLGHPFIMMLTVARRITSGTLNHSSVQSSLGLKAP